MSKTRAALGLFFTLLALVLLPLVLPDSSLANMRMAATKTRQLSLHAVMCAYSNEYGRLPPGDINAILKRFCAQPHPYMENEAPRRYLWIFTGRPSPFDKDWNYIDGWGRPFKIRFPDGNSVEIVSFGPNRKDDGGHGDDIVYGGKLR